VRTLCTFSSVLGANTYKIIMATTATTSPQAHNTAPLPPITTESNNSNNSSRLPPMRRISSSAKERLSVYSNVSQHRSRPVSHVFPLFHSSLPYALVRDFAYAPIHPLHYGPLPVPSRASTPASEAGRRLSDPQTGAWEATRNSTSWSNTSSSSSNNNASAEIYGNQQLPAVSFGDGGPPYSEDEDLHSPIITARYRKHKSVHTFGGDRGRSPGDANGSHGVADSSGGTADDDRGTLVAVNGDGSETYYVQGEDASDGPGGEYITYPAGESRYSQYAYAYGQGNSGLVDATQGLLLLSPSNTSGDYAYEDEYSDRYSRDYHFSIGSPDEEMHGKAVALFDFTREHENELPLKEGQVILVSYRHGQGWLVAEDPRTGESGLVPEEFVRLVRDIEGGLSSLNGELSAVSLNAISTDVSTDASTDVSTAEQEAALNTPTTPTTTTTTNGTQDKHTSEKTDTLAET
jgi:SH3 domain